MYNLDTPQPRGQLEDSWSFQGYKEGAEEPHLGGGGHRQGAGGQRRGVQGSFTLGREPRRIDEYGDRTRCLSSDNMIRWDFFLQIIKFYILFFQQFFLGKVLTYLMITKLYTIVSNFNFVITASSLQILCSLDISNSDSLMKQASFVRNDNGVHHVQHHAH